MSTWREKRTFGPIVEHKDGSFRAHCTWCAFRLLTVRALRYYALSPSQLVAEASAETVRVQDDLGRLLHAAEADRDNLLSILDDVRAWAEHRCPCENEKPDPCPLCGEPADGGACRSVQKSFPGNLGERIRHALAAAERVRSLNAEQREGE